jgi:gamma-butyrobetaine dioxygenase
VVRATSRGVHLPAMAGDDAGEMYHRADSTVDLLERFPAIWLRDNCGCPACRDPASGQKLFGIEDLPDPLTIESVRHADGVVTVHFGPDGHRSIFDLEWLLARPEIDLRTEDAKILWSGADPAPAQAVGSWPRYGCDEFHRKQCLQAVLRVGFVLLRDVPAFGGAVLDVARGFGYVRETNYGPSFDLTVQPDAPNLAFTSRAIPAHTDNPYRDPVPTLQLLHCLANEADGGDSGLVDGFRAAAGLRADDPDAFDTLTCTPVTFRYATAGVDLSATAPLIAVDPRGRIHGVRYNNRSTQPLRGPYPELAAFYRAYRAFAQRLAAENATFTLRLEPGDCLVFDNTRILHARTGFAGSGRRHLQGCYADLDAVESQWRTL